MHITEVSLDTGRVVGLVNRTPRTLALGIKLGLSGVLGSDDPFMGTRIPIGEDLEHTMLFYADEVAIKFMVVDTTSGDSLGTAVFPRVLTGFDRFVARVHESFQAEAGNVREDMDAYTEHIVNMVGDQVTWPFYGVIPNPRTHSLAKDKSAELLYRLSRAFAFVTLEVAHMVDDIPNQN